LSLAIFALTHSAKGNYTDTSGSDSAVAVYQEDTSKTYIVEINRLLQTADKQLGTPYRWAGKQPGGFDCSGFVLYCYGHTLGISTPASATSYTTFGTPVSKANARPGDVICFQGYNSRGPSPGHVGIITEVTTNEIYFIHSASHGGIRYDKLSQKYYADRFLFIRRILN